MYWDHQAGCQDGVDQWNLMPFHYRVGIGLGIAYIFWISSGLVPVGPLLTGAGLYLWGLVSLAAGAILVTNKQPIDLLQVKE